MLPVIALLVSTGTTSEIAPPPPPELDARLRFLEEHLEEPKLHARVWWWGWLSFYSAGAAVQSVRLALVDPLAGDARAQRADLTISIVKALGGVVNLLLFPLNAAEGAEPMRRVEGDDLARLAAGEAALEENARESERRHEWLRHLLLFAVNLTGATIVWLGYDDLERGLISAAIGIGIGELALLTQPWQPGVSWKEYRALR